jgi:hypothetical protein
MIVLASLALARPVLAQEITPTSSLHNPDNTLAGFATTEPSLYFLVPSSWSPLTTSVTPPVRLTSSVVAGQTLYDLRLVLSPDYGRDTPTVVALRGQDPHALFFPLPMLISQVTLFLPEALGSVQAELVPDETGLSSPVALYYRLRFTADQVNVLRTLSHSGLALTGAIAYSYVAPDGPAQTAAPMTIVLDDIDLAVSTLPPPDPTAWLADLLASTQLNLPGVIDGPYALGAGITVQVSHSQLDAHFLPATWVLHVGNNNTIQVAPTKPEDLAGTMAFDIAQLGAHIHVDFRAAFAATLDLSFMQLTITQFNITSVTVNGAPSPFFTTLLNRLLQAPKVQTLVSAALSDELQRRILAQTLFTLGDAL